MKRNRIAEKGGNSMKIAAHVITVFFVVTALLPVLWMLDSSLKDIKSIDAYPPKWIPSIPVSISVTIDYSDAGVQDNVFYEKDAMKATWFPWMKNLNESIGEVTVRGVKDNRVIYKSVTTSSSFQAGQPLIVPSTVFNDAMMNVKLPIIQERHLSKFTFYGTGGGSAASVSGKFSNHPLAAQFKQFYTDTSFVKGKIVSIDDSRNWVRLFDSYLSLNKIAQDSAGALGFFRFFLNSGLVTLGSVVSQLVFGGLAGYTLSQLIASPKLKFALVLFFLGTIMIPDVSILLPLYLTMQQFGLVNSLLGIILPHTAWGIVIFLFKGFFDQLPNELIQAARVDGASELRTFTRIIVPMSVPVFTIVAISVVIPVWNEFMWPLIVTKTPEHWTFTVAMNNLQTQSSVRQNTIMASSVVAMLPLLIVFMASLKHIEKAISFSGVKG